MELDNKLATYRWTGTVTSLYRRLETKFLDHSSLDIVEDDTCINFASLSIVSVLPQVMSYAKVSKNGQEEPETRNDQWIVSNGTEDEGRSIKNIAITMSPVYISPKVQNLKNGEAINYFPGGRYSTLDHELIAQLNSKKQVQDRYHPGPINSFKSKDPPNDVKENSKPASRPSSPPIGPSIGPSSPDMFDFSKPTFSESYDYKPPDYLSSKPISKPPDYLSDKPISKPMSMDDYANSEISDKNQFTLRYLQLPKNICATYFDTSNSAVSVKIAKDHLNHRFQPPDSNKPDSYFASHDHESSDYTDYSPDTSYNNDAAPKPIEYSGHLDHPPFDDDDDNDGHSYGHHHHDFHHEVIYDHIPEHHEHIEAAEMNDQRLDKRPYSYYYIGRKLWYIPLYFSIYFIIYIAALVLKSIARHKITFPAHLADVVNHHARSYSDFSWLDFGGEVLR
ncbi:unnamed protein product, partial [Heterotrigona itama]